jgi:hypothetical protein
MRYLRWTRESGALGEGLTEEWTEVADDGHVVREVGFDVKGRVAHKMPSKSYKHGKYGLFDLAVVSLAGRIDEISPELFEQRWREGKD